MSLELQSEDIKEKKSSQEHMDDDDVLLNEICSNAIRECKKESIAEIAKVEARNYQEDGKRKFDHVNDLRSHLNTKNSNSKNKETTSEGSELWTEAEEEYQFVPKRIRESHNVQEEEQRHRNNSASSSSTTSSGHVQNQKRQVEYETEPAVLARRQKDIDYGKNTIGYDRYIQQVSKEKRTKDHPRTPPMHLKYTRRGWDGMVKLWRKQLHLWDPPADPTTESSDDELITEETSEENGATCQRY